MRIVLRQDTTVLAMAGTAIETTEEYGAFLQSLGVVESATESDTLGEGGQAEISDELLEAATESLKKLKPTERVRALQIVFGTGAKTFKALLESREAQAKLEASALETNA